MKAKYGEVPNESKSQLCGRTSWLNVINCRAFSFKYNSNCPLLICTQKCIFAMSAHNHDDVIKWKHFPRYWPFVRSQVNSPHKGQWRGALMLSLIFVWINGWVNNRKSGDLRRYHAYYDIIVVYSYQDCRQILEHFVKTKIEKAMICIIPIMIIQAVK